MAAAGVPIAAGQPTASSPTSQAAERVADEIGYPVMVKAAAGGGGKGIRIVRDADALAAAVRQAQNEAEAAFGNRDVYLEKLHRGAAPRRDPDPRPTRTATSCTSASATARSSVATRSSSRKSPSPAVDPETRAVMGEAAVEAARAVGLPGRRHGRVPPRRGRPLLLHGDEHPHPGRASGHRDGDGRRPRQDGDRASPPASRCRSCRKTSRSRATPIEFRINAEDPANNFLPSPGLVAEWAPPGGPWVRVDSHVYQGYTVPPFYDSLLAKLIVWGRDRDEAIRRGRWALASSRSAASRRPSPSTSTSSTTRSSSPAPSRRTSSTTTSPEDRRRSAACPAAGHPAYPAAARRAAECRAAARPATVRPAVERPRFSLQRRLAGPASAASTGGVG